MVADLLGVTISEYTGNQMTYDLRRLRLKGLNFRPPRTNRCFVTPYGWKVARVLAPRSPRIPARYRHVHQQRRRVTVPPARIRRSRRQPTGSPDLSGLPANEGFLKRPDLVTFIKI
jgi:hypothetical protein